MSSDHSPSQRRTIMGSGLLNFGRSRGAAGHDVIVHGDEAGNFRVNGNITNPNQIAEAIRGNPNYGGGPINLVTCHGACGAAQELQEIMGVPVNASPFRVDLDPWSGFLSEPCPAGAAIEAAVPLCFSYHAPGKTRRAKYKRVSDLYVTGTEVVLKDGTVLWPQVVNPFEIEEARQAAQTAKARLVLALKEQGGDELNFIEAALWEDGPDGAWQRVVDAKASSALMDVINALRVDAEWTERITILDRTDEAEKPLEPAEKELFEKLQLEYVVEVQRRVQDEEAFLAHELAKATREEPLEEYKKLYIDRRGTEVANNEFRITEVFYGARVCEGVQLEGDEIGWDHSACEGHQMQVFESKGEVRVLPEELQERIGLCFQQLAMSLRDAKDLDRLASSSVSSRQPSEEAASTPSTQGATPSDAPGTSAPPSLTPSPS